MQQFSNQEIADIRSRIDQIHEMLASRAAEDSDTTVAPGRAGSVGAPKAALVNQVSFSIQMRRLRRSHFGGAHLSGAIWDMMLDLMLADTNRRELSASDLATGAGVPLSSGLRMIGALEELGLAQRSIDARDRRRSIVRLTDSGTEKMESYFEKIGVAWQDRQALAS